MEKIKLYQEKIAIGEDVKQTNDKDVPKIHKFYFKFVQKAFGLPKQNECVKLYSDKEILNIYKEFNYGSEDKNKYPWIIRFVFDKEKM